MLSWPMPHDTLVEAATTTWRRLDGVSAETRCWFVPGRLEVLGKHTDYAGGRSLLCAAERGMLFLAAPRADARVRIVEAGTGAAADFTIAADLPGDTGHWPDFPMTVARRLARDFPGRLHGVDMVFTGDLPRAAGMSSSSALVVGCFTALADVNALQGRPEYAAGIHGLEDLADYLGAIESGRSFGPLAGDRGVGTAGGSEDHTAMLCCGAERLGQFVFGPTRRERSIPFPAAWTFAIAVSGVVADKIGAAREPYNRAAALAEEAARLWREATGRSDPHLGAVVASSPDAADRLRDILRDAGSGAPAARDLLDRCEQFLAETTEIIPEVGDCLARGDVEDIGLLVDRSQKMAERLLKNQVSETVALARLAREHGAAAASAFGAGFGGAVWALVQTTRAAEFLDAWAGAYRAAFPSRAPDARFLLTRPGPPLRRLEPPAAATAAPA
jgi:galactokinase